MVRGVRLGRVCRVRDAVCHQGRREAWAIAVGAGGAEDGFAVSTAEVTAAAAAATVLSLLLVLLRRYHQTINGNVTL